MDTAIILHRTGDEAAAERVAERVSDARFMRVAIDVGGSPISFGPHLPLVFVWTEQAERSGMRLLFATIARSHPGGALIASGDGTPAPEGFAAALTAGDSSIRSALARAAAAAAQEAAPKAAGVGKSFAAGMARGIVGGAAVFGVGGIAIAASNHIETVSADATAAPIVAPATAVAAAAAPVVAAPEADLAESEPGLWIEAYDAATAAPAVVDAVALQVAPQIEAAPLFEVSTFEAVPLGDVAPLEAQDFVLLSSVVTEIAEQAPAAAELYEPETAAKSSPLRLKAMQASRRA